MGKTVQSSVTTSIAAIKGDKILAELTEQFDVHPNQISEWKQPLQESAINVFGSNSEAKAAGPDLKIDTSRQEANGNPRDLSQAQHQQAASGAPSLSVSVAEFVHHPLKPCLDSRYHVHPNEARLRLSVRRDRLGKPSGVVMAII